MTREQLKDYKVKITLENAKILLHILEAAGEAVGDALKQDLNNKWHPVHSTYTEVGFSKHSNKWVGLDAKERKFMTIDQLIHELANLEPEPRKVIKMELNEELIAMIEATGVSVFRNNRLNQMLTREGLAKLMSVIDEQVNRLKVTLKKDWFSLVVDNMYTAETVLLFLDRIEEKMGDGSRLDLAAFKNDGRKFYLKFDTVRRLWITSHEPQGEQVFKFSVFANRVLKATDRVLARKVGHWGQFEVIVEPDLDYIKIGCQSITMGKYEEFVKNVNELIFKK